MHHVPFSRYSEVFESGEIFVSRVRKHWESGRSAVPRAGDATQIYRPEGSELDLRLELCEQCCSANVSWSGKSSKQQNVSTCLFTLSSLGSLQIFDRCKQLFVADWCDEKQSLRTISNVFKHTGTKRSITLKEFFLVVVMSSHDSFKASTFSDFPKFGFETENVEKRHFHNLMRTHKISESRCVSLCPVSWRRVPPGSAHGGGEDGGGPPDRPAGPDAHSRDRALRQVRPRRAARARTLSVRLW